MNRTGNSRIAVVGWGRGMGHKGHMYLASSVITQAKRMNADPYFFVSKTVGKDDPLYPEEKVAIYQHVFPQEAQIFMPQGNLNKALEEVAKLGYEGVVVVVGADQKEAFQYLEKPTKQGVPVYQSLGFKKLKVISRQETGDESAGLEGPRATPMREILLNPDATDEDKFKVWRDAMPDALGDREVTDLMHKAEGRLMGSNPKKLKESRIMDRNALINAYYVSTKGQRHKVAEGIPYYLLDKLVSLLTKKYNITMNDIEVRPVNQQQYRRTSQPELAEGEHERLLSHDIAISLNTIKPDIFTRFGDEYILSLIDKCINDRPNGHKLEIMTDVMKHLTNAVKTGELYEFAPDGFDGRGDRPKFLPWNEFIGDLKAILGDHFDVVENVVKTTIKARFVPHDPMEFGPTMLYSYYETRAGRNKGAVSTRGAIQVGKYIPNTSGLGKQNYITTFNLLKGHPFERHFDLTGENVQKIADIIIGNTEGAYQMQQVEEGKFNELSIMISDYYNTEISDVKFYGMYGITRQQFAKDYAQYLDEDQQLDEFAPSGSDEGDDGFSEETLKMLAAQWYNGDEDPSVERTLMAAGWEIGQDEGYDNEPGVFVVQRGDVNGNSYMSWPAHELSQNMNEDYLDE